jgi:hypothetical protein
VATKPKRWPTNALRSLEDTLALLHDINKLARDAQVRAAGGDFSQVVILNGDIREKAQKAIHFLVQARTGEY